MQSSNFCTSMERPLDWSWQPFRFPVVLIGLYGPLCQMLILLWTFHLQFVLTDGNLRGLFTLRFPVPPFPLMHISVSDPLRYLSVSKSIVQFFFSDRFSFIYILSEPLTTSHDFTLRPLTQAGWLFDFIHSNYCQPGKEANSDIWAHDADWLAFDIERALC